MKGLWHGCYEDLRVLQCFCEEGGQIVLGQMVWSEDTLGNTGRKPPLLGVYLGEMALLLWEQDSQKASFPSPTPQHRQRDTCLGQLTWTLVLCWALLQTPCPCNLVQLLFWDKPASVPVQWDLPPEDQDGSLQCQVPKAGSLKTQPACLG